MSSSPSKQAVHFGAGNIGRGFIGPLLAKGGYHVVFADVDEKTIDSLNEHDSYDVHILDSDDTKRDTISNISGVLSTKPDVQKEIVHAELITTAVGVNILPRIAPTIAKALSARRKASAGNINIIACENKVGATTHLKEEVFKHLKSEEDKAYVNKHVGFANCSVDRIVPPFDASEIDTSTPLDVGVEGFYEWAVEESALKDPKPTVPGMKLTDDLEAYVERKLYTLNTGHAITAYLGFLRGMPTIDVAIEDEDILKRVRAALNESGAVLVKKHGFKEQEHREYIEKIETRFRNPSLKDDIVRVGREPLRKLSRQDRLLGPAYMTKEYGLGNDALLYGAAAAFLYDNMEDEQAKELQERIKAEGIEKVVADVTGFEDGSEEHGKVVKAYGELKKSKIAGSS